MVAFFTCRVFAFCLHMNIFPSNYSGVSPTRLLDESMIPLVGTPHTMTYIPMEEVFAFVERRPNQELPAITEENEVLC